MVVFRKSIGDFDRIVLEADGDWAVLTMHVGVDEAKDIIRMTFRSDDAMRDLLYVVSEYVRKLDERDK